MALYSLIVVAQRPSGLMDPMVMLDKGMNVFTAEIADLDEFLKQLKDEGVEVKTVNRLDDFEATDASDLLLGEGFDGEIEI